MASTPFFCAAARRVGVAVFVCLVLTEVAAAGTVEVNGRAFAWDKFGCFVLPAETLRLAVRTAGQTSGWVVGSGLLLEDSADHCRWVAPELPGVYPIALVDSGRAVTVNVFVMIPADSMKNGQVRGFTIGRYPKTSPFPRLGPPRGFIEVTKENAGTPVSPRYVLGDFVPYKGQGLPQVLALHEDLPLKLELLTDLLQEKGIRCDRLKVMCGFRTVARQRSYGAGHQSAHMYGGAADVYVDSDGNGTMDDLNHDGASDSKDARLLLSCVDELEQRHPELVGGGGWYRRTRRRGPFIHTDVRGEHTRWHQ
uniref:Uncharacterized protein n=1 Tax=candidate division WOR-3 bacterium TaxID=2052148 RepID=A0A7C4GG39_UNCW3